MEQVSYKDINYNDYGIIISKVKSLQSQLTGSEQLMSTLRSSVSETSSRIPHLKQCLQTDLKSMETCVVEIRLKMKEKSKRIEHAAVLSQFEWSCGYVRKKIDVKVSFIQYFAVQ